MIIFLSSGLNFVDGGGCFELCCVNFWGSLLLILVVFLGNDSVNFQAMMVVVLGGIVVDDDCGVGW